VAKVFGRVCLVYFVFSGSLPTNQKEKIMSEPIQVVRRGRGRPPRAISEMNDQAVDEQNGVEAPLVDEMPSTSIKSALQTENENKEYEELAEICAQLADKKGKVRVYRLGELGARPYVCEMEASVFSIEYIKNEFGGGDYIAQFVTSANKMFGRKNFEIDRSFKSRQQRESDARQIADLANGGTPRKGDTDTTALIVQMMQQGSDKSDRMFQMMLQMQAENSKNLMLMMGKMFEGGGQRHIGSNFSSQATLVDSIMPLLLKNAEAPAARGPGLFDDVDKLLKLKELFSNADTAEKDDMFTSLLKALAPAGAALLAKAGGAMPQQVPQQLPPAAPAPQLSAVAIALPMLVSAARKDGDPALYHDMVAEHLDDLQYEQLVNILEKPDWCKVLFNDPPEIQADQNVKAWFEKLRLLFTSPDPEPEADPELEPAQ